MVEARVPVRAGRKRGQRPPELLEKVVRNLFSRYMDKNREFFREELIEAMSTS